MVENYQQKVDLREEAYYQVPPPTPPEPKEPELFDTLPLLDTKTEAHNRQLEKEDKRVQVEVFVGREKEQSKDTRFFDYRALEQKGPYRIKQRRDILHTADNRMVRINEKMQTQDRHQRDVEETESQRQADIQHLADQWQPTEKTDNPDLKELQKDLNV